MSPGDLGGCWTANEVSEGQSMLITYVYDCICIYIYMYTHVRAHTPTYIYIHKYDLIHGISSPHTHRLACLHDRVFLGAFCILAALPFSCSPDPFLRHRSHAFLSQGLPCHLRSNGHCCATAAFGTSNQSCWCQGICFHAFSVESFGVVEVCCMVCF